MLGIKIDEQADKTVIMKEKKQKKTRKIIYLRIMMYKRKQDPGFCFLLYYDAGY